jgi:hypothetical protein
MTGSGGCMVSALKELTILTDVERRSCGIHKILLRGRELGFGEMQSF